ncbi:MAG: Hsp20/alpha crystallin family protein [Verrucomicrobiota bacterium]
MKTLAKKDERAAAPERSQQTNHTFAVPRVDIVETRDEYVLEAEMPGVNQDGLEVLLEDQELTLVGRRVANVAKGELVYRESTGRDYRRVFALDPSIDTQRIVANMEQGVLTLRLPKAEKVKPRKIQIG